MVKTDSSGGICGFLRDHSFITGVSQHTARPLRITAGVVKDTLCWGLIASLSGSQKQNHF